MVTNTTNAEHYVWGGDCEGWRLLAREDLSVIEERIPPGRGEVPHYHERARQVFYVLTGALEIELGARTTILRARDSIEVPPGQPHRVRNPFEVEATFLVISAPTTRGDRIDVE